MEDKIAMYHVAYIVFNAADSTYVTRDPVPPGNWVVQNGRPPFFHTEPGIQQDAKGNKFVVFKRMVK